MPESKHYIVYPETTQGRNDSNIDMRRKTRAGRNPHCEMALGCKPPLNSNKLNIGDNSKNAFETAKTRAELPKETKIPTKPNDISPLRGFCEKLITPDGSVSGVVVDERRNSNSTGSGRPR